MKPDFSLKRNFAKGIRIHKTPDKEKVKERTVFLLSKAQRTALNSYCAQSGMSMSDVVRIALNDYFEKVNFHFEDPEDNGNKDQLKMF
jgi:hypothetical protein